MKKFILVPIILLSFFSSAQITKVEHFFISSPGTEKLFNLFRDEFQLPVIWKFQSWGDFASGGVSLGNIAFEFVNSKGVTETKFGGIAFEPKQHLEEFIIELDKIGIAHDTIANNSYVNASGRQVGWSTLGLFGLLPDEANIFICDYKARDMVAENRQKGTDSLLLIKGGPLGILSLAEIVINTKDFKTHSKNFANLPGVQAENGDLFKFSTGPSIRLVPASTSSFDKILIKVRSLAIAKQFLQSKNLLGATTSKSIYLSESAFHGLKIELSE